MNAPFEILEQVTGVKIVSGNKISKQHFQFAEIFSQAYEAKFPAVKTSKVSWDSFEIDKNADYQLRQVEEDWKVKEYEAPYKIVNFWERKSKE